MTRPDHHAADPVDAVERAVEPAVDPASAVGADDLDAEDAFGHPAVPDPARDDAVWSDGDEDDLDV